MKDIEKTNVKMTKKEIKQHLGKCDYCFVITNTLRKCQLRASTRVNWQHPIDICGKCRKHLLGQFRYSK